tara:strand:+ start:187 stop:399 length:213 start_codon:yes stop_codon:yes gene_type:complete
MLDLELCMVYTNTGSDKFGTASRTITLPLSSWGQVAECAEIMEVGMKVTLQRAIAVLYAQQTAIDREISN